METTRVGMGVVRDLYGSGEARHWFDKSTMRFFRSKLPTYAYRSADGGAYFFVTSEQFVGSDRVAAPRKFSVRAMTYDGAAWQIETWGKFQAYAESRHASKVARTAAQRNLHRVLESAPSAQAGAR